VARIVLVNERWRLINLIRYDLLYFNDSSPNVGEAGIENGGQFPGNLLV
jgi:hypothetical protein